MTAYISRSDRQQESASAEQFTVRFDPLDEPIRADPKCQVCGATERRHTAESWDLHHEEIQRRVRHEEARLARQAKADQVVAEMLVPEWVR